MLIPGLINNEYTFSGSGGASGGSGDSSDGIPREGRVHNNVPKYSKKHHALGMYSNVQKDILFFSETL